MRAVENNLLSVPLGSGMNEAGGQRSSTTALYRVRNARLRSEGSLQKRCGTTTVSGATTVPSGTEHGLCRNMGETPCFIASLNDQVLSGTTAGDCFAYGGFSQVFKGCFSSALPRRAYAMSGGGDAYSDVGSSTMPASAVTADGYIASAYVSEDDNVVIVVRGPDGNIIYTGSDPVNSSVTTNRMVRIVVVGSDFYVCWTSTLTRVTARQLTISSGLCSQTGSDTNIVTLRSGGQWDASSYDGSNWYISYYQDVSVIRTSKMAGLTESSSVDLGMSGALLSVSVWADADNQAVWVGYLSDNGTHYFAIYTAALAVTKGQTVINATLATLAQTSSTPPLFGPRYSPNATSGAFGVLSIVAGASPATRMLYAFTVTSAGVVCAAADMTVSPNQRPVSKPDAKQRVWCTQNVSTQGVVSRFALLRFPDAGLSSAIVGNAGQVVELATQEFSGTGNIAGSGLGLWGASNGFHAVAESTDLAAVALPIVLTTQTNSSGDFEPTIQVQIFEYTEEPHRVLVSEQRGLVCSGQPTLIPVSEDRYLASSGGCVESGFAFRPVIMSATASPAGSGLDVGSYAYVAVVQWPDPDGRRQLSGISDPVSVDVTVTSSVEIRVTFSWASQRPPAYVGGTVATPTILLYRTTANGQFYQELPLQGMVDAAPADGSVVFTDTISDTILSENEFVYTDGGVLPNVLAPSCRFMVSAEDRLWCGGLWDPTILEASKIRVPGEPTNFTGDPTHQVVLPEACTGLAYMDGQVIAFAESTIYLVGGDGPNDQGAGTFLPPRALVRGIGCIDYRSIVETPIGVLFQSKVGIYIIPRGFGSPQYIGSAIQDTITNYSTVLASAMTSTSEFRLARFLIASSVGGTSGTSVLTLDIDNGQWFLDSYVMGQGTGALATMGSGPDGALFMRRDLSGTVAPIWVEDETTFADDGAEDITGGGSFIARSIQTTWLLPFGPAGSGWVKKAVLSMAHDYPEGVNTDAESVSLTIETDDLGTSEAKTWTVAGSATNDASYRGFDLTARKCTTVRATISESASSGEDVRGPKFLALTLEIEGDGGIRMLTSGER